jgi:hypothetical protein
VYLITNSVAFHTHPDVRQHAGMSGLSEAFRY